MDSLQIATLTVIVHHCIYVMTCNTRFDYVPMVQEADQLENLFMFQ